MRKEPRASLESSASADSVGVDLPRYLRGLVAGGFTTQGLLREVALHKMAASIAR